MVFLPEIPKNNDDGSAAGFFRMMLLSGSSSVLLTEEFLLVIDDIMLCRPLYFSSSAFPSPFEFTLAQPAGMSSDKIQRGIKCLQLPENT
jgi:hypothetical protein